MKKVYNYRNTTDINCVVDGCPIGFHYSNYPHIAEKRHEFNMNPLTRSRWMLYKKQDKGKYLLNIDFKNRKLIFSLDSFQKSGLYEYLRYQWYYDVSDETIGIKDSYKEYFYGDGEMTAAAKRNLVPIDIEKLGFNIKVKDITSMEVVSKWWKSYTYIHLNFNRVLGHGTNIITLYFDKDDSEDFQFVINEINTMRRMIQSEEQEKILERLETIE